MNNNDKTILSASHRNNVVSESGRDVATGDVHLVLYSAGKVWNMDHSSILLFIGMVENIRTILEIHNIFYCNVMAASRHCDLFLGGACSSMILDLNEFQFVK